MTTTKIQELHRVERIWITKHALTKGIIVAGPATIAAIRTVLDEPIATLNPPHKMQSFYGKDFHLSLEAALNRAEQMRRESLDKLQGKIKKLQAKPIVVSEIHPSPKDTDA